MCRQGPHCEQKHRGAKGSQKEPLEGSAWRLDRQVEADSEAVAKDSISTQNGSALLVLRLEFLFRGDVGVALPDYHVKDQTHLLFISVTFLIIITKSLTKNGC